MAFVVTSWNVENFATSKSVFEDKLEVLVKILRSIEPDVVGLQEILDDDAAARLAQELGMVATLGEPDGRGNRVAFLTKTPPLETEALSVWRLPMGIGVHSLSFDRRVCLDERVSRPALRIQVEHSGRAVDLVCAHLKSKLLTFPGGGFSTSDETLRVRVAHFALGRRSAEALTLRESTSELLARGRNVVLLGDFNDGPHAATTTLLYGPSGSQPQGPADATKAHGAFQKADNSDPRRLFNVCLLVPDELCWSRRHKGNNELLDHILASEGMMPRSGGLRSVPVVEILNADAPNRGDQPVDDSLIPDHAPVTARFQL